MTEQSVQRSKAKAGFRLGKRIIKSWKSNSSRWNWQQFANQLLYEDNICYFHSFHYSAKRTADDCCCCLNSNLLIQWFFPTFRSASICMQNFLIQTNRWVIHCENSSNCCWSRRFLVSKSLATIICYEIRWLPHTKMVSVSNQKICEIDIRIFFLPLYLKWERKILVSYLWFT